MGLAVTVVDDGTEEEEGEGAAGGKGAEMEGLWEGEKENGEK